MVVGTIFSLGPYSQLTEYSLEEQTSLCSDLVQCVQEMWYYWYMSFCF